MKEWLIVWNTGFMPDCVSVEATDVTDAIYASGVKQEWILSVHCVGDVKDVKEPDDK